MSAILNTIEQQRAPDGLTFSGAAGAFFYGCYAVFRLKSVGAVTKICCRSYAQRAAAMMRAVAL
ncbi:hypothetical protein A5320_04690 [Rheinheimera sp. SA_1]|jgi:hypothetical protein|nr:hypothetical protein A5320_04690 [Rheinheimera sp. SA_1]